MKIAVAGILNKPIVPNASGGTESFVYQLVEGLVAKKHEVTLFATSDSQTSAKLVSVCSSLDTVGMNEGGIETRIPYHLMQSAEIIKRSDEFDVIHNNYFDSFFLTPFNCWSSAPIISTVHNDFWQFPHLHTIMSSLHRKGYDANVFVSLRARELAGVSEDASVIHNGVSPSEYPLFTAKDDNLLWLSRIVENKGPREAVEAATVTKRPLRLIGFMPKLPKHLAYYDAFIKPFLSEKITVEETLTLAEKVVAYQRAKAFLFPIQWEEPFGLVMIEAMSCGTPVIAFARGAVPEIVEDGVSGFIVNASADDIRGKWVTSATGQAGMHEAIERLYSLPPEQYKAMCLAARLRVEQNFTIDRLVSQYEQLYVTLAAKGKKRYFA